MNAVKQFDSLFGFVRLQLSDQMQFYVGIGGAQVRPFGCGFLHPVFAEHPVTRVEKRADFIGTSRFRNRNQRNIFGRTLCNLARFGHFDTDVGKAAGGGFGSRIGHGRAL